SAGSSPVSGSLKHKDLRREGASPFPCAVPLFGDKLGTTSVLRCLCVAGLRPCRSHTILLEATMASLELRSERYRIVFYYGGAKFQQTLKTSDPGEAEGCRARLEENLRLLERGRLQLPPDADLPTFLLSDGKVAAKPPVATAVLTLEDLCKSYAEFTPTARWSAIHSILSRCTCGTFAGPWATTFRSSG